QGFRISVCSAAVVVAPTQNQNPDPILQNAARSADGATKSDRVAPIERQGSVVDDISGNASGGFAIPDLQRSCGDSSSANVGVVGSEDRGAGSDLGQVSIAGDQTRERDSVSAIEGQRCVIGDIPSNAAAGSALANLQRSCGDSSSANVGVVGSEDRGAGPDLG